MHENLNFVEKSLPPTGAKSSEKEDGTQQGLTTTSTRRSIRIASASASGPRAACNLTAEDHRDTRADATTAFNGSTSSSCHGGVADVVLQ
jgi:hypothetical protein